MTTIWLIIIIFSIFTGLLFGIGGFLIHKWWFKPYNDFKKALIFVENIPQPYKATMLYTSSRGTLYLYHKGKNSIFVPSAYRVTFHHYRRMLYLDRSDTLVAIPFGTDTKPSDTAKNELIQELVTSHIGAEAIHAIKGKSGVGMAIIVVALIVAVASGAIGYALHKPTAPPPTTLPSATEQPAATQPEKTGIILESSGKE